MLLRYAKSVPRTSGLGIRYPNGLTGGPSPHGPGRARRDMEVADRAESGISGDSIILACKHLRHGRRGIWRSSFTRQRCATFSSGLEWSEPVKVDRLESPGFLRIRLAPFWPPRFCVHHVASEDRRTAPTRKPPAFATMTHGAVRCQTMPPALRGQRRKASRFESGPGHLVTVAQ